MTPDEIAGMLDRRFALLGRHPSPGAGPASDSQTGDRLVVRAAGLQHRKLFDELGVFAGSFDMAAVMAVAEIDEVSARSRPGCAGRPIADRGRARAAIRPGTGCWIRCISTLRTGLADSGVLPADARRHAGHYAAVALSGP